MHETDAAADARGQAGRRQGAAALGGHELDAGDERDGCSVRDPGRRESYPAGTGHEGSTEGREATGREPDGPHPDSGDLLTHASFFSGVGGLDLGLERAGWRTVCFSEIEPYACAVLAERWPGVPNLGDIVTLGDRLRDERLGQPETGRAGPAGQGESERAGHGVGSIGLRGDWELAARYRRDAGSEHGSGGTRRGEPDEQPSGGRGLHHPDWQSATLWSGGFPCQDLSIAGKRRGLGLDHGVRLPEQRGGVRGRRGGEPPDEAGLDGDADAGNSPYGTRSGLAFAFLDLVGRHRPRWVLLENVPGLLSSHKGRDMAALLERLTDLGYGVAWRVLDARYYGVPQRRRRVFILATNDPDGRVGAERAAKVLAVAASGGGHPAEVGAPRPQPAGGAPYGPERVGIDYVGALPAGQHGFPDGVQEFMQGHFQVVGPSPDPGGVREADGLAGRVDDREDMATYYLAPESGQGADLTAHEVEQAPAITPTEYEKRTDRGVRAVFVKRKRAQSDEDDESWDENEVTPTLNAFDNTGPTRATVAIVQEPGVDDDLLPKGLDSHRYRVAGNGVVSNVAEAIGQALAEELTNGSGR